MSPDDLKGWRERMGLTQRHASVLIGVGRRTYQAWEGGEVPIPVPVERLAKYIALERAAPADTPPATAR